MPTAARVLFSRVGRPSFVASAVVAMAMTVPACGAIFDSPNGISAPVAPAAPPVDAFGQPRNENIEPLLLLGAPFALQNIAMAMLTVTDPMNSASADALPEKSSGNLKLGDDDAMITSYVNTLQDLAGSAKSTVSYGSITRGASLRGGRLHIRNLARNTGPDGDDKGYREIFDAGFVPNQYTYTVEKRGRRG